MTIQTTNLLLQTNELQKTNEVQQGNELLVPTQEIPPALPSSNYIEDPGG